MKSRNNAVALTALYFTGIGFKIAGLDVLSSVVLILAALVAANLIRLTIKEILSCEH